MIVSLPFIAVTFILYGLIPLKHGHGKLLMSLLFATFSSYLLFVISSYVENEGLISPISCTLLVVVTLYFTFASYCWMSTIHFDGWITIRDSRGYWDDESTERRRRFWYYTAFSWVTPLLLLLLILTVSKTTPINTWYNPGLSNINCWLNDGIPEFIYLILPMLLAIIGDITFLALTFYKIINTDLNRLTIGRKQKMLYNFYVRVKLLSILLVNWLLDLIAWALKLKMGYVPISLWYLTEVCNGLVGILLLLFMIIFNKKMRILTIKRFNEIKEYYYNKNSVPTSDNQ